VGPQGPDHPSSDPLDADQLIDGVKRMTRPVRDNLRGLCASDARKQHEEPGLGGVQVDDSGQIFSSGRDRRPHPEASTGDNRDHHRHHAPPAARSTHGALSVRAPLELRSRERPGLGTGPVLVTQRTAAQYRVLAASLAVSVSAMVPFVPASTQV
jgi:hypothetical protein